MPTKISRRVASLATTGEQIGTIIDDFITERPHVIAACLAALEDGMDPSIPKDKKSKGPDSKHVLDLKQRPMGLFGDSGLGSSPPGVLTEVDGHFIEAWRKFAGDPDYEVGPWLVYGAPCGH